MEEDGTDAQEATVSDKAHTAVVASGVTESVMAEEPQVAGRLDESPESSASNELLKIIKEGGLNPEKWMQVFSNVGVKNVHSLQCMGAEDYTLIKKHAQWPWEEQALRNLLNIPDPQDSLNKTKEEQTKQKSENQVKANTFLEETKKMVKETKICIDKKKESKAETLQKSKSLCIGSSSPLEALEEKIEKLHKSLIKDTIHSSIANLSDEDVLLNASGGLALEGIYLTMNQEDILDKHEQLLAVPKGINLTNSRQSPVLDHKEFSSSAEESLFHKSMEKLGFSMATAAKVGFGGFQANASFGYSTTNISKQKQESHSELTYISTTKYNYIPLASCYITKEQLCLSTAALKELKTIEDLEEHYTVAEKPNFLRERCENFFRRFGSHANQGPLQFGGIFWWTATSQGFKEEMINEVKTENKKALSTAVDLSYSGLCSASGSTDVEKTEENKVSNKEEKRTFETETQLFVTKTGGPLTVDTLKEWQLGLNASNKTWSVIDRGSCLTPVWEIILFGHKDNFKNVYQVAQHLKEVYGAITSQQLTLTIGENVSTAIYEANVFLSGLNYWDEASAQETLNRLIQFRQHLNEKTGNFNVWLNICLPHKELQGFFKKVMQFYKQTSKADESLICGQLKLLLQDFTYSSENLDSYFPIYKWLYPSKNAQETNISNFSTFINFLSHAQRDLLKLCPTVDSEEEAQKAQVKCTVIIHSYVNSFLKTLRYMEQYEEELLVLCAASSVGYSVQDDYFRYCLSWEEVNFMVEEMKSLFEEFKNLRDLQVYKAQAFILAAGLTSGDKKRPQSTGEKKQFLQLMLEKMQRSLEDEIQKILQNYSGFSDLQSLLADLNSLISGDHKTNIKVNSENLAKEIQSVCEVTNQPPTTESQAKMTIASESDAMYLSQDVINLLTRLGLDQHFPKGLNRRNFHVVHASLRNQTEKESDLPLQFMQMLMRLDYRFRYLVCKDNSKNRHSEDMCEPENETSTFETIEDLLSFCSKTESNTDTTSNETIHPMDLLMAIYHCSDDFMRQYSFTKLSTCQFALPFLVPRPYDTSIELPLWAFRQVQKSILDNETGKHEDRLISQTDVPVVCFTRLGTSPFSKSQILNNLLSKHRHDIFFHRNCDRSIKTRVLMDGMAEIFWFCPSGKDTDQFEKCTAFVNLRGDAREHKKQAAFLQNISSINVMLFSQSEMNDFKNVMPANELKEKPLIILLADKEIPVHVHKESKQVIIGLKNQNEAKVLEELTKSLRRLLASSAKPCSLEACATRARQCGFLVDEDSEECVKGKHHAQTMLSLLKQNDLLKSKEELLPLSGHLWHSWCKKDRELTRLQNKMNQSIEQHCSKIKAEKKSIRQTQLEKASQNQFIKDFITKLKSLSKTSKLFFLQWFKILVDNLSCDRVVKLQVEYNSLWTQLQSEQLEDKELAKALPDKLEDLSVQMNAYMFGLEHVLREVGQTYEALHDLNHTDECFYELPKIAADMMLSGYPIELMDGDACYVPLKWIKAVLQELIKIIGDKKLFVLSVLGVQSSGKSTLLNTMFGLQFAVSAGRCTRGAFMQLIEIFDDLKMELGFDYILVVDTEGLRAMELSSQLTLNHDNELATFAIGVGNMTLINVFGENPSEIKDILQIAVQAFLRMKQVKLSSSCLFIHQNVGDLTALDKNMEGRRKLQKELDKMTALAAEQELCNIQCFSEVIRFDPKHHIQYFSHLWEGNPPMAPPNPHYSEDTQKVKDSILRPRGGDPHSILSISKFIIRIEDLWSALRNENFVFSFKNTLEISVYSKVESKYRQLSWELRRHFLELQAKLNNRIKKGDMTSVSQKDIEKEVKEKFEAVKEEFESFFNEDKDKEILIQWKANTENRLNSLQNDLIEDTKRQGTEHIRLLKSQNQVKQRQTGYEEELFIKSKQLALYVKKKRLQESELRDQFNILWQEWVAEITRNAPHAEEPNIIADAEDVLLQYFPLDPSMSSKLTDCNKWMLFSVDLSNHVAVHKCYFWYSLNESDRMQIQKVFNDLVKDIMEYLVKKQRERVNYNKSYFHEIINDASEEIKIKNSSKMFKKFTFTKLFKFDVSVYLFGMAVPIFQSMHEAFRNENDPVLNLESKREDFFNCFTIACQGAASIKTFADLLCSKLLEAIHPALYSRTALAIVDEMTCNYPAFSGNRAKLETYILIDLAEQEDFEQYRQYLHFPEKYFRTFIEKCVESYCFDKGSHRLKDFLHISLDRFQQVVLSSIRDSTRLLKNKSSNVSEWLDDFYERIEDLVTFSRADLKGIEHQEIQDIEFIQEAMCTAWDSAIETFKKDLETTNFDCFEKKPHEILAKQLCGCWEQCPFCGAICTNTIPCHDGDHSVPFHRPQAITGIPWLHSDEFVLDICSNLVSSMDCLVLDNNTQILYRNYRKIGPNYANWSITPDTSFQPYWKWYVSHFRSNLESDYMLKFEKRGEIPAEWGKITKTEVIAKLKEQV